LVWYPKGVAKLHDAATITATTKGIGLTPSCAAVAKAIGKTITEAALLVTNSVRIAVVRKTKARAAQGLPTATLRRLSANVCATPVLSKARPRPKAAPIVRSRGKLMLESASSSEQQRVTSMAKAANAAASSIDSQPRPAASTINSTMAVAIGACALV